MLRRHLTQAGPWFRQRAGDLLCATMPSLLRFSCHPVARRLADRAPVASSELQAAPAERHQTPDRA
jgi:hypothetical protein